MRVEQRLSKPVFPTYYTISNSFEEFLINMDKELADWYIIRINDKVRLNMNNTKARYNY